MSESALRDRYLDLLLEMVFEEQEKEDVERLSRSPDPELTEEQSSQAERILEKAFLESDHQKRTEASHLRSIKRKQIAKGLLTVLAMLLLFSTIGFAASAEFREAVLRLFMRVNEKTNTVWLYPDEEASRRTEEIAAIQPPDGWTGKNYFQFLPDGFSLDSGSAKGRTVRYICGNKAFTLAEHSRKADGAESEISLTGLDCSQGTYEEIGLLHGRFVKWEDQLVVVWEGLYCWFELIGENMDQDELLSIASSVSPIEIEGDLSVSQSDPPISIPEYWTGEWFPDYLPGGLHLAFFSQTWDSASITFANDDGRTISFREDRAENTVHGANYENTVISKLTINGEEATLIDGYSGGGNTADVIWRAGDTTLCVSSAGFHRNGTVRVAESVRRLQESEKNRQSNTIPDSFDAEPPRIWQGRCFPEFLPEGFRLTDYQDPAQDAELIGYRSEKDDQAIKFREWKKVPDLIYHANGNAQIIQIGENEGFLVNGDSGGVPFAQALFCKGETWYTVETLGVSLDQTLKIAASVRENERVTDADPVSRYAAGFIEATFPDQWTGNCYPRALPRDMAIAESETRDHAITWEGENKRQMILRYSDAPREINYGESRVEVTPLTINGHAAYMMRETLYGVPSVCMIWKDESAFYELRFRYFDSNEALAVARGIT